MTSHNVTHSRGGSEANWKLKSQQRKPKTRADQSEQTRYSWGGHKETGAKTECFQTVLQHWTVTLPSDSASYCSCSQINCTVQFLSSIFTALTKTYSTTPLHGCITSMSRTYGELTSAWWIYTLCVCVRGMWIVRTRTHWHMYTYADLHTPTRFLYGGMINRGIFGSSRAGSEKSFQLQRHLFFLFLNWFTRLIPVYRFFTTAVWASSSHHLIFSEVTRKSQPLWIQ